MEPKAIVAFAAIDPPGIYSDFAGIGTVTTTALLPPGMTGEIEPNDGIGGCSLLLVEAGGFTTMGALAVSAFFSGSFAGSSAGAAAASVSTFAGSAFFPAAFFSTTGGASAGSVSITAVFFVSTLAAGGLAGASSSSIRVTAAFTAGAAGLWPAQEPPSS